MEKPIFKEKIRLRSYGIPKLDDDVFFEIKTKYKGVVGKRRHKIKLKDFYQYMNNHEVMDNQVLKEIDYFITYYGLKPVMYISYDRLSYASLEDNNLRITLDYNLKSRIDDLMLEKGDMGNYYFKDNYYIMEIKTLDSMPLWLVRALSSLGINPTSFSKYGSIYKEEMEVC